jgi:hypothetical protein
MKCICAILVLGVALVAQPQLISAPAVADKAEPIEKMIEQLKQIAELTKQLDDPKFEVRQLASERLIRIGQPAVEPLKQLLTTGKLNLEMATRIESILKGIRREQGAASFRKKLAERVTLDTGLGPNAQLRDALEFFAERYDISILVQDEAFQAIGVPAPGDSAVQLPKMTNVPLRQVLHMLLSQIRGDEHRGTFLIREDHIEVTTTRHANPVLWIGQARQGVPVVSCDFEREPLAEALRQLSESTGISVVLDPRSDKARKTVSAALDNVPLDTAVGLLADMADLKAVSLDNVLYVTSRENAKELEVEKEKRAAKADALNNPFRPVPMNPDGQ